MRLARILDHDQSVLIGHLENGVHIRHLPIEMHRHNCRYAQPQCPVHQLAGVVIHVAARLQILAKAARIHVGRGLVDVHELRPRARLRDGFRRGDEGVRHRDHDVAPPHARRHQRESERIRAAAYAYAMTVSRRTLRTPARTPPRPGRR